MTPSLTSNPSSPTGHVMEIFSSVQGEGPLVGVPQIFFRLYRCNLRCRWCDTPESFALTGKGKVESPPASRQFLDFENPISPEKAIELLVPFLEKPHHSISFTGGEPLVQYRFLKKLLPILKEKKEKIFLETGGTLPELLEELIPWIEVVSMDLKLPSSTKEKPFWEKHEAFLKIAAQKEVYVKIVATDDTKEEELEVAFKLVKKIAAKIPVVLQPVTPFNGALPPKETQILKWQEKGLRFLSDVRIIPQVHKLMNQK
jgi:7-carboxy-7-deazaguanine synthase